ncbi:hypothetical protein RchiOBHm_Chr4g0407171 [Rosa chinensis]|uniref:Uncharacterized protein n=1 Tax=Rosa chinensis TaxID=74649 RepID=A0A2P6QUI4_ROSCH|nr:hypothetical protein RchiOBHm_Chr4g0407171 [Rosa chinensis]
MLRTALAQSPSLPDFSDLRARILAFDAQQQPSPSDSATATALLNQGPIQAPQPRRRDNRSRPPQFGGRPFGNYRYKRGGSRHQFVPSQQHGSPQYASYPFPPPNRAARSPWATGLLGPSPHWCPNCHTDQHGLPQCPHRFSGPSSAPPFAGSHSLGDLNWYPDTGATHHMTAMPLNNSQPYGGPHNVYMGNGDSMPVLETIHLLHQSISIE